jgi:hypothetical protein
MSKGKQPPPPPSEIEIEMDGVKYRGSYTVQSKIITVSGMCLQTSTQVGQSSAEDIARIILGEHVIKSQRKK